MATQSFADMEGWDELQKFLQGLPKNMEARFVKKALREAAVIVEGAAKVTSEFKDRSGRLRRSIQVQEKRNKKGVIRMGVIANTPYAHLVEKGFQVKTKSGTKHVPGRYFLTKALLENRDQVLGAMKDVLGKEIIAYEKKMLAKAKREARKAAKAAKAAG